LEEGCDSRIRIPTTQQSRVKNHIGQNGELINFYSLSYGTVDALDADDTPVDRIRALRQLSLRPRMYADQGKVI
jgi:hypothetical protein